VSVWLIELVFALIARVLAPGSVSVLPVLRPLLVLAAVALLLVPTTARAPEAVRAAITGARALTRALAR
jgi:hypothetical protein